MPLAIGDARHIADLVQVEPELIDDHLRFRRRSQIQLKTFREPGSHPGRGTR